MMELVGDSKLLWASPLLALAEQLSHAPIEAPLLDAAIQLEGVESADSQPLACDAMLRLGGVSGFELSFQSSSSAQDLSWLINWSFGATTRALVLTGRLSTGEHVTARCRHLADGRFDLQHNTARGAFTSLFIEVSAHEDAGIVNQTEIVVSAPAWLPKSAVRDTGSGLEVVPGRGTPSIELETLHLEHEASMFAVFVRVLRAADDRPDGALGNILDSMSFLAGCRLFPQLVRQQIGGRAVLRVFRRRDSSGTRFPPMPVGDGAILSANAWGLFAALYRFMERQPVEAGHRCALTMAMAEVHGAMRVDYISTKALIVCIAVESLVNRYVVGTPPLSRDEAVKLRTEAKDALQGFPAMVAASCCDTIGRMCMPNTHNALMALADASLVDSQKARRWRDVRGRLAHGHLSDAGLAVEAFGLSIDLFHRIAASIVGFSGILVEKTGFGEVRVRCAPIPVDLRLPGAAY